MTKGLPKVDIGRIGLAIAPQSPDMVYAIVEAADKAGGFFRSTDGGGLGEARATTSPATSTTRRSLSIPTIRGRSTRWTP